MSALCVVYHRFVAAMLARPMFVPLAVDRYVVFIAFPSSIFCLDLPKKVQVILVSSTLLLSSQVKADNRTINEMCVVVVVELVNFILFCLYKVVHRNVIIVC